MGWMGSGEMEMRENNGVGEGAISQAMLRVSV